MKRFRRLQKIPTNAVAACFALFGASLAAAEALPDPTRPPAGFIDPAEVRGGAGRAAGGGFGGAGQANGNGEAGPAGLVLQSVLLPEKGRPVAVISGHYLPLGAKLEEWELKSVNERQAVLEQGGARRVLLLTPQVSKTMAKSAAPAEPTANGRTNSKRQKPGKAS